jgi:hypothetical protein
MPIRPLILSIGSTLYSHNAFRLTGLPVEANAQDISRAKDRLGLKAKLGANSVGHSGAMAPTNLPDIHTVQDALARLKDPERRLVDDFFWFWPLPRFSWTRDPAIQALIANDPKTALAHWQEAYADPAMKATAIHNIAVLHHLVALERTHDARYCETIFSPEQFSVTLWEKALGTWHQFFKACSPSECIAERISLIDDVRLSRDLAREFTTDVHVAIGFASASLALHFAKNGDWQRASFHVEMLKKYFQGIRLDEVVKLVIGPTREQLSQNCQRAVAQSDQNPRDGLAIAQRLVKDSEASLRILGLFLQSGNSLRDGATDQVALAAMRAINSYSHEGEDWKSCKSLMVGILSLAATTVTKEHVRTNLAIIALNELRQVRDSCTDTSSGIHGKRAGHLSALLAEVSTFRSVAIPLLSWIKENYGEQSKPYVDATGIYCGGLRSLAITIYNEHDAVNESLKISLEAEQICRDPSMRQRLAEDIIQLRGNVSAPRPEMPFSMPSPVEGFFSKYGCAVALLLCLGIPFVVGIFNSFGTRNTAPAPIYTPPRQSPPVSSAPQAPPPTSNPVTSMPVQPAAPPPYQAPPASTGPNLSALKASIERSQATLGELDREITQYEQQLASDNSRLDNFKKSLDALDSQSAAGGNVDASYYNSLVDQHNLLLAASKDRLARRNAVAKRYNALLVSTNADIDRYNKAVMGY